MGEHRTVGRRSAVVLAAAMAVAGWATGGCGAAGERPLTAGMFMPPNGTALAAAAPEPDVGADPAMSAAAAQPAKAVVPADAEESSPKRAMILTPDAERFDSVRPLAPLQPIAPPPTTAPAEQPAADVVPPNAVSPQGPAPLAPPAVAQVPTGVYMTVGGVLAQVNDTPIYAHTVLALLERELSAKAHDLEPDAFRDYASRRVVEQLHELVMDELVFSTAKRTLSAEDLKNADAWSAKIRQDTIKRSGGSVELARRQAADRGYDFDDLMRQHYRDTVRQLYQARNIDPQVQVTAGDMREFYAAEGPKLYGDKDRMLFRLLEIDPKRFRGDQPRVDALAKIRGLHDRAAAGQDFAALATANNDDDDLKSTGGDPGGWMDRHSFRLDAVEDALWALRPGQVTDVVEVAGAFYLAKLEAKHEGHVKPFDDPAVQDDVYKRLAQRQQTALWAQVQESTLAAAVVTPAAEIERRLPTAVEMAMQKYARWAGR